MECNRCYKSIAASQNAGYSPRSFFPRGNKCPVRKKKEWKIRTSVRTKESIITNWKLTCLLSPLAARSVSPVNGFVDVFA